MLILPKNDLHRLLYTEKKTVWEIMEMYWCRKRAILKKMQEYGYYQPIHFEDRPPVPSATNKTIVQKQKEIELL